MRKLPTDKDDLSRAKPVTGGVFLTVPRKKIKKEEGKERKKEKGETPIP